MPTKPISALEVVVFDWPDRFLVECDSPDCDYPRYYPELPDFLPDAPYLVDLSEFYEGWCACRDFAVNIQPNLERLQPLRGRTACKHILAVRDYLHRINYQRPKQLPNKLF